MEKMSFIFFIIIVFYLILSFLTRKNKNVEKKNKTEKNDLIINKKNEKEIENLVMAAIAAAVAAMMAEKSYVLKRVYLTGEVDEKKSSWKNAARSESMMKRNFF